MKRWDRFEEICTAVLVSCLWGVLIGVIVSIPLCVIMCSVSRADDKPFIHNHPLGPYDMRVTDTLGRVSIVDAKVVEFNALNELNIYPFIIKRWEYGQDCLGIEYKGKTYKIGDSCGK